MSREIKEYQVQNASFVFEKINSYLLSEGYNYTDYAGENVYKKGQGVLSGPTFFKLVINNNIIHMEAWMKFALLPGVYVGEFDLKDVVGAAVKETLKKRIETIDNIVFINNSSPSVGSNPFNASLQDSYTTNRIFCQNCGTELKNGTLFCTNCGLRVEDCQNSSVSQFANQQQNAFSTETNYENNPDGLSKEEFVKNCLSPKLVKDIKSIAILCYVCAGITAVFSLSVNPLGIIDALLLLGFALGMQFSRKKIFAILILILSVIEVVIGAISGAYSGILWLVAGIWAVVTFNKIDKEYQAYLNSKQN